MPFQRRAVAESFAAHRIVLFSGFVRLQLAKALREFLHFAKKHNEHIAIQVRTFFQSDPGFFNLALKNADTRVSLQKSGITIAQGPIDALLRLPNCLPCLRSSSVCLPISGNSRR